MRHHGQVAAVSRAQASNTMGRAVGIERVHRGGFVVVVNVADRGAARTDNAILHFGVREEGLAFPVSHPDTQRATFHALQHDAGRLLDLDGRPATFKALALVVDEPWLLLELLSLLRDPAKQSHELASVADAKAEGILAVFEGLESSRERLVEADRPCPPFGAVHYIGVAEASNEDHATEGGQVDFVVDQVRHVDVPSLETSHIKRRTHLSVSVTPFLPDDGYFVPAARHSSS
mmetsp:Transcript_47611/g.93586  ORF Transcript_47611/g.93586 Transcript_47611/m.93586 type:complete len:233 (+) Transcript_47611:325-1023(+)